MTKPIKPADWLLDSILQPSTTNRPHDSVSLNAHFLAEGSRNADLTSLAGFFVRKHGIVGDQLEAFLQKVNEAAAFPLSRSEVAAIARSVSRYASEPATNFDEAHLSADLAQYLSATFRYAIGLGWMWYNERHWEPDEGGKHVQEATKLFVKSIYAAAKAGNDSDRVKAARGLLTNTRINNLQKLASSDPMLLTGANAFDSKSGVLNLGNGTLDWTSGSIQFRPHDPADLLTKCADVEYEPEAGCPEFDGMMRDILSPENGAFVMRYFGYAMSGTFDQQTFAIFHGAGANGKSTLVNAVLQVLDGYGLNVEPSTFMMQRVEAIRNDLARLKGARLAVSSELGVGEMLNAALLKRYVGGDAITARFLFKEHITFKPTAVPVFVTNALPIINGADEALARRIVLLHFDRVIPVEQRDPRLPDKLWRERSGILNRLLAVTCPLRLPHS